MIFVTGPLFAGKQEYIMKALGWDEAAFEKNAVRDVQELAALTPFDESEELAAVTPADSLEALADSLASKQVVIATEVGGGVVPLDPVQRREREAAGRLACLLAARADIVVRVYCGIPCLLKGERLP
ncbi:MAG: bifunctional adenosylcobinamide kinase/adenosylcobinamide-phosphate guanylyltransferase [Lachnospiraceae bacterium]|nr:bifunctional adenosylcobinamide kinase/adenosylcobinamide-phosphate guanylyltransferase [Lachnospiraceae bacterium]